jgi:hypothetical protein
MTNDLYDMTAALSQIAAALGRVAHGGADGPTGIEALSMAIDGHGTPGRDGGLAAAVREGLENVADAIRVGLGDVAAALAAAPPQPGPTEGQPR